jgi:hypothetical protein
MDETLSKALAHLLEQIDEVVEELLLVEVDWGEHTPAVTDEPVEVDFQGSKWPLVFTASELVLRRVLCRSPGGKAILVFRNDDGFKVPLDMRARAHKNTPYRLGLRHRLYALTGRGWPPEVDYAEWRPSIARHFDALVRASGQAGLKWDMTRSDLEEILVQAAFGLTVKGREAPRLLANLVSAQRKSPEPPTDLERSLLQGQLRLHQVERSEVLIWAAEELGRAEELIRTSVMMGAEQAARLLPNWGRLNSLRVLLVNQRQMPESDAVARVVELTTAALSHLHPSTRRSIVKAAQTALAGVLPPEDSYNPWFPDALERESERIAQLLAARKLDATTQVARLHDHLFADQHRSQLSALDEMARLVMQWGEQEPRIEPLTGVSDWAVWYAQQGARMDLTALKLMRLQQQGTDFGESIQRLLNDYWRWRDELNATFAKRFVEDYEAALHDRTSGVFGTHRILDWVVRPLLQEGQPVLLLVIDGMSFADLWHLSDQWADRTPPVYVRWPFGKYTLSKAEGLRTPPQAALSLLPSVTSVSRKALFLNALPTDRLDDEETYQKKARTSEARALQSVFRDRAVKLYNKANLDGGQQLITDLQFRGADLIAVILNTIDDDLKSTTPTVRLPRLEDMGPLVSVLRHALEAGWKVVMTADHGHTWHRHKKLRRGDRVPGGGERFAPLTPEGVAPEGAVVTQDPHIVRVQEGKKVALLTSTGAYFGRLPRRGYHGGAGLEEVVVPCAFLTYEAPPGPTRDEAVTPESAETERPQPKGYDLAGVVLALPDGRVTGLDLPFTLSPRQIRLLQTLARLGEASEAELKRALGTRRIAGPLAALRDRLAAEGLDYIEHKGSGPGGATYRFRVEMLE